MIRDSPMGAIESPPLDIFLSFLRPQFSLRGQKNKEQVGVMKLQGKQI